MAPIAMIEGYPGPRATIRIGPKATFGIAFKITRYGSIIFENIGDHHSNAASKVPSRVPKIKPKIVSVKVTPRFDSNDPS